MTALPPDVLSWLIFMSIYHTAGLLFHLLDIQPWYKIRKQSPATPTTPTYLQMLPRVLLNQTFVLLPCMRLCTLLHLTYSPTTPSPPPFQSLLSIIALGPLIHELSFYAIHRYVLHTSFGLRTLNHALHHSSTTHSAISAMYMSAPDFFLEIVVPYLLPLTVLSTFSLCGPRFCIAALPVAALGGLYEHSGYNFFEGIQVLDTTAHALHHRMWGCSFADGVGAPSIVDPFMGTSCGVSVGKLLVKGVAQQRRPR